MAALNHPMSAIAYCSNGRPTIFSLPNAPVNVTNPFVEEIATLSSAHCGLVLYHIPNSPWCHLRQLGGPVAERFSMEVFAATHSACLALVFNVEIGDIHVIRVRIRATSGSYIFDEVCLETTGRIIRESSTGDIPIKGRINLRTALSCGTKACWLTDMPELIVYETMNGTAELIPVPGLIEESRRQLGVAGGKLCIVSVTESRVKFFLLECEPMNHWVIIQSVKWQTGDGWNGGNPIICREAPVPLRFHSSCRLEALLWVDGRLVLLSAQDILKGSPLEIRPMPVVPQPDDIQDCIPIAMEK